MKFIAIIVAGGSGQRANTIAPKQFNMFGQKMLLEWSLDFFQNNDKFAEIILVLPDNYQSFSPPFSNNQNVHIVNGGNTRTQSVKNALEKAISLNGDIVFIHDAARPGLSNDIIDNIVASIEAGNDGVVPALKISDAMWEIEDNHLKAPIDRNNRIRVQTPQAFKLKQLYQAYSNIDGTFADDAEIALHAGLKIGFIDGDNLLDKITYNEDFKHMEKLLLPNIRSRIGMGFDAHKLGEGAFVTLCGVEIKHDKGLIGHSDADVAWHALVDAILGAIAEGDIGKAFPPSEAKWKGASSKIFLEYAVGRVKAKGGEIENIDITIICESPKIGLVREELIKSTALVCDIPISSVSVKATTTELMGFTGRKEGIAAQAIANIIFRGV